MYILDFGLAKKYRDTSIHQQFQKPKDGENECKFSDKTVKSNGGFFPATSSLAGPTQSSWENPPPNHSHFCYTRKGVRILKDQFRTLRDVESPENFGEVLCGKIEHKKGSHLSCDGSFTSGKASWAVVIRNYVKLTHYSKF